MNNKCNESVFSRNVESKLLIALAKNHELETCVSSLQYQLSKTSEENRRLLRENIEYRLRDMLDSSNVV